MTYSKAFKFLISMAEASECWCWIRWDTHGLLAKNLKQGHNLINVKAETLLIKANDASSTEDKTNSGRPTVVSITSVVIFLLGFVGLLLGIVAAVGALLLHVAVPSYYALVITFWFVAGPCLILAGYNLWKRKKWAALLATAIILFDLITGISQGHIDTLVIDMIFLVLIGSTWKQLQ